MSRLLVDMPHRCVWEDKYREVLRQLNDLDQRREEWAARAEASSELVEAQKKAIEELQADRRLQADQIAELEQKVVDPEVVRARMDAGNLERLESQVRSLKDDIVTLETKAVELRAKLGFARDVIKTLGEARGVDTESKVVHEHEFEYWEAVSMMSWCRVCGYLDLTFEGGYSYLAQPRRITK